MSKRNDSPTAEFNRSHRFWWIVVIVLAAVVFGVTLRFGDAPAPSSVVLATGGEGGGYDQFGTELSNLVMQDGGPDVELRPTTGSFQNFELLRTGDVKLAFVQSGTPEVFRGTEGAADLRVIAALYSEPLWVFHNYPGELSLLSQMREMRIGIGPDGSGTQALAKELLQRNAVTPKNADLQKLPTEAAIDAFEKGQLDMVFLVASPDAEWVKRLLHMEGAHLFDMVRHRAYARHLPHLRAIEIPQGLVSLEANLPPKRVTLLSANALLMAHKDMNHRVVEHFLKAAMHVFGRGNLVDFPGEYPRLAAGMKVHEAAEQYMKDGESWASQNLPFWAVRLISRAKLFLIPLVTVLLPAFKLVPALLRFRIRHLIKRHYEKLRDVESRIRSANTPEELQSELALAVTLRDELSALSSQVPGTYQDSLYSWRMHVDLVRREGQERLTQSLQERSQKEEA